MLNYEKFLFSLIEGRKIQNFPITKEVCEDTKILEHLIKYDNENCYKLQNLKNIQEYAPDYFVKLLLHTNKAQYELEKILPELNISKELAQQLLDVNDQYISYFPQFQNKEFLINRLRQGKAIGLNRLHTFCNDKDIAQTIIELDNEKDFRWIDKELYVEYMDQIIRKKNLVCHFLESFEYYDPLPYEPNKEFYEIILDTNLYALRYIYRELPQDINYVERLFSAWQKETANNKDQEHISEWQNTILLLIRELPAFVWQDNQAIEQWFDIISQSPTKIFYDLSLDKLLEKMISGNDLFKAFSETEYCQNLLQLHEKYYINTIDFDLAKKIFFELEQLSVQWHNFKLNQELTTTSTKTIRNKI